MKIPTWAYIVGIGMMLFGGCRVSSSIQATYTPSVMDIQKEMIEGITDGIKTIENDTIYIDSLDLDSSDHAITKPIKINKDKALDNVSKVFDKVFHMSDFTRTWMIRFGFIGTFVAVLYIFGGIFLLVIKKFSLKLAYTALSVGLLFSITKSIVLASDSSAGLISIATGFSQIFWIVIDIIFIIVIVASDKSAYQFQEE